MGKWGPLTGFGMMVMMILNVESIPTGSLPEMDFTHHVLLDQESGFTMMWTPHDTHLVFEVRAATTGYIGFGFSPNGGMKGADIVIGWVDDDTGEVFLHDRHASGYEIPKIDQSQDVELLGGHQNDTHTVLRFTRPWDTCDNEGDMPITNDTMRVIWAYNHMDPIDKMVLMMHTKRGTKSLFMREPLFKMPPLPEDVKTWDVISENAKLPNSLDTLYWCKIHKIPSLDRKAHIIGFVPLIQEGNAEHVHHIVLYECKKPESDKYFAHWLEVGGLQCHSPNMPASWRHCSSPLLAWAVGSDGEMFPEHVGFPVGEEHGGATYFMMEMHYDNPNLRQDVIDSSGLRVFYTETLRKYEAANLAVGHDVTGNMIIPPEQEFLTVGHCISECTQSAIPPEGINVFHGLLHAHLLGSALKLRQIRDGVELPTIFEDMTYDFNYQQHRVLEEEMKILPGDYLMMECGYDALQRKAPTFGGLGTNEEMCIAFLSYYPRIDLAMCASRPSIKNIYESVGFEDIYNREAILNGNPYERNMNVDEEDLKKYEKMKDGDYSPELHPISIWHMHKRIVASAPEKFKDVSLFDVLNGDEIWQDSDWINHLQNISVYGKHHVSCATWGWKDKRNNNMPKMVDYPSFIPYEKFDQCAA